MFTTIFPKRHNRFVSLAAREGPTPELPLNAKSKNKKE
jgi:hypothetical protein